MIRKSTFDKSYKVRVPGACGWQDPERRRMAISEVIWENDPEKPDRGAWSCKFSRAPRPVLDTTVLL